MGFKSIQTKYIVLVLLSVIASAVLIGTVCVRNASNITAKQTAQNMNLICESYVNKYDISLKETQSAVEACAIYGSETLESIGRFASDEAYRDAYANQLERVLRLETLSAVNVTSFYVRFSPDLLSFERGFRYSRATRDGKFERAEIVRIQDYMEADDEYVGWYYTPIANGKTTWLEPYYNANFGSYMISCVTPFYKGTELIGVIGMDIDFSTLVDDLQELRIFDNGYAFLCNSEGEIFYHPLYEQGTYIQQDVQGFDAQLGNESSGEILYRGVSKGEEVEYAFRTLTNGMRLVLRAPEAEINAEATGVINAIIMLVAAIVAVSILITVVVSRRITKPLSALTDAAKKMSQGHYDIDLDISTRDEVATLANTLKDAASELKASTEYMEQLAYRDSLTGVNNKTAYDMKTAELDKDIANGDAEFGIIVFDVNDLKTANDLYGHKQGDKVLRTGCSRICRTFLESPVYRVGGDEFVAVVQGEELEHAHALLNTFARRTEAENAVVDEPQDAVNVAAGIAVFDPSIDASAHDVFNRADEEMYKAKQAMKNSAA